MSETPPPLTKPAPGDAETRSLVDDLRQLLDDGRTFVEAELAYQSSRAKFAGRGIKSIALLGLLGAALAFFALMALVIGTVIALAPVLTAWGATAAVCLGCLLMAGACFLMALSRWKRMAIQISGKVPGE